MGVVRRRETPSIRSEFQFSESITCSALVRSQLEYDTSSLGSNDNDE